MKRQENVDLVRNFLLRMNTQPGERLPTERALVDALGIPRSAVRNALAVLESDGQVIRKVGSGTYLAPRPAGAGESVALDVNPQQIVEARFALEPNLAGIAAMNCTKHDLDLLAECASQYHAANDFESFEEADEGYHATIARATHNPVLIQAYQSFSAAHDALEWGGLRQRLLTAERRVASRKEHDKVLKAIRSRDPGAAAEAMREHLNYIAALFLRA